jgi:hypothetical protein
MSTDPTLEPRFQRRVWLIKWCMVFALTGVIVAVFAVWGSSKVLEILGKL